MRGLTQTPVAALDSGMFGHLKMGCNGLDSRQANRLKKIKNCLAGLSASSQTRGYTIVCNCQITDYQILNACFHKQILAQSQWKPQNLVLVFRFLNAWCYLGCLVLPTKKGLYTTWIGQEPGDSLRLAFGFLFYIKNPIPIILVVLIRSPSVTKAIFFGQLSF